MRDTGCRYLEDEHFVQGKQKLKPLKTEYALGMCQESRGSWECWAKAKGVGEVTRGQITEEIFLSLRCNAVDGLG